MVIAQGGLGGLSRIDLDKVLAGTTAFVRADIGETEEGLAGGASRKDLETMFQLVYLTFTAPRADPVAFGVLTDQLKVALANQAAMPDTVFDEALDAALSQNHLRAQPLTPARVDSDESRQVARLLQGPLRRCERLHLRLRGELRSRDHEAARGALPGQPAGPPPERDREGRRHASSGGRRREAGEERHRAPEPGQHRVQRGVPERRDASSGRQAMAETLAGNLQRTLREDLGGTYGVSVVPSFTKRPTAEYRLTISFACDPARTESLVRSAFQVIEEFKRTGPGEGQVADARAALMRDFETNSRRNDYLLNRILFKYEYGEDVKEVFNMRPFYDQLTVPVLRDAARAYLDTNRYVEVTLLPETR